MSVLDAAFHAVHDYPGGASALAVRINKGVSTLCHELRGDGTAKLGLVDAVKLSHLTGSTAIVQAFAAELGGVFMPLAPAAQSGDIEQLGQAAKEFGELAARYAQAVADGRITRNELVQLEREAIESIGAITTLLMGARARHEAGKPAHLREVRAA